MTVGEGARRFARADRFGTDGPFGVGIWLSPNGTEYFLRTELAEELLKDLADAIKESKRREGGGKA